MKFTPLVAIIVSVTVASTLIGCNKNAIKSAPVGFLSQPHLMKEQSDGSWQYLAPKIDWTKYSTAQVVPVALSQEARQGKDDKQIAALMDLAMKFQTELQTALGTKYSAVQTPAANTLVVRAQIVKAQPNAPALNLAPQTQIGGLGYGYGEIAVEVVDGATGAVLYEFAGVQNTKRFSLEKASVWGSIEASLKVWAKQIATACKAG